MIYSYRLAVNILNFYVFSTLSFDWITWHLLLLELIRMFHRYYSVVILVIIAVGYIEKTLKCFNFH